MNAYRSKTIAEAARQAEITEQTYYSLRKEYCCMNTSVAKKLKCLEKENARLKKLVADLSLDCHIKGCKFKKLLSPVKRKTAIEYVVEFHSVTERQACQVLSVNRTAYRYEPVKLPDEAKQNRSYG